METDIKSYLTARINLSSSSGPELTALISESAEAGLSIPRIKKELFALCNNSDTQKMWADWESVSNREEIRLRLQAIFAADSLDSSLAPFVLFFFRASDPVVYQIAARIVGKWLHTEPAFQAYIQNYLSLKKINPEEPIVLNGQRARRRLLIVFAEYFGNRGSELKLNEKTVKLAYPVQKSKTLSDSPSSLDMGATVLALSILQQYEDSDSGSIAKSMLAELQHPPHTIGARDRNGIRTWGMLLATYSGSDKEKKAFFTTALEQACSAYHNSRLFTDKLHSLFRVDEIVRSGVFVFGEKPIKPEELLPDTAQDDLALFCRIRFSQWAAREGFEGALSKLEPAKEFTVNHSAVQLLHHAASNREQIEPYLILIESVSNNAGWRLHSVSERGFRAFILLDFATHCQHVPAEELKQVLSTLHAPQTTHGDLEDDKVHVALTAVLLRLIDAEHTAKAQIPDSKLIHKIYDESLLLQLLPSHSDSDLLPVLADAFENRIRLLLTVDPDFNLDHYLYLISVREPNRKFYRFLKELTIERNYTDTGGNSIYFREKIAFLYNLADSDGSSVPDNSRFWKSVVQIRKRIRSILDQKNLFSALELLEHELDGTGTDALSPSSTLHDLVNIVQPGHETLIKSGFPGHTDLFHPELNRLILELKSQLKSNRERLVPLNFSTIDEAGETAQRLKTEIHQVSETLAPVLGSSEASVLQDANKHFEDLLTRWGDQLSSLSESHVRLKREHSANSPKYWSLLFDKAVENSVTEMRSELLGILITDMLGSDRSGEQINWFTRYQFLSWACQSTTLKKLSAQEKERWLNSLRPHWENMVQTAMDLKQEARVLQMVREPELAPLRRTDSAGRLLREVKTWCFNRYDMLHASVCNRELSPEGNFISIRWKTFREYFAHFANVWVALIVGVILMFDFGDPWTELAEMGNVGGVLVTFLLGVAGTYMYVFYDLRKQITFVKTDPFQWASLFGRVGLFLAITLTFTVAVIMVFWLMFSETDQVMHGFEGLLHIMAWTGFALFMGVFFGLIGKQ